MRIGLLKAARTGSFWQGLLRGLASPVELFTSPCLGSLRRSEAEALRGDWENIGRDFGKAITYERGTVAGNL